MAFEPHRWPTSVSMIESPFTQADLETTRTAADLLPWVMGALDLFRQAPLRKEAREGKHFAGELVDEMLPIALFAHRYFQASSLVNVRYVVGNQKHDAVVDDRRASPGPVRFIETTVADYDYEDAKRMELLNRDGNAPAFGGVTAKGPRHNRTELRAELVAVDHDVLVAEHIGRADQAVRKKVAKQYPDGTALVVRVSDSVPFRESDDVEALEDFAARYLVPLLKGREFCVLAFVGSAGLYLPFVL